MLYVIPKFCKKRIGYETAKSLELEINKRVKLLEYIKYDRKAGYDTINYLFHLMREINGSHAWANDQKQLLVKNSLQIQKWNGYRPDDLLAHCELLQVLGLFSQLESYLINRINIDDSTDVLKLYLINYYCQANRLAKARTFYLEMIFHATTEAFMFEVFKKEMYFAKMNSSAKNVLEEVRDYLIHVYPSKTRNILSAYDKMLTQYYPLLNP